MYLPIPSNPSPPAATVGKIEVPTIPAVEIRAAPPVTIGNTTKINLIMFLKSTSTAKFL